MLAGVLCAFVAGENNLRSTFAVKYECSTEVLNVIDSLEAQREQLYYLQTRYGIDSNLAVDLRLSGRMSHSTSVFICQTTPLVKRLVILRSSLVCPIMCTPNECVGENMRLQYLVH